MSAKSLEPERRKMSQTVTRVESSAEKTCCGDPMQPRLVQAVDRNGERFTIAIWYCPRCAKAVY